jgi:hypothetical protein
MTQITTACEAAIAIIKPDWPRFTSDLNHFPKEEGSDALFSSSSST